MSSGERPIGTAEGKQPKTEALCQPPPPPASENAARAVLAGACGRDGPAWGGFDAPPPGPALTPQVAQTLSLSTQLSWSVWPTAHAVHSASDPRAQCPEHPVQRTTDV